MERIQSFGNPLRTNFLIHSILFNEASIIPKSFRSDQDGRLVAFVADLDDSI